MQIGKENCGIVWTSLPGFEHVILVGPAYELGVVLSSKLAMILKLDVPPQQFNDITSVPQYPLVGQRINLNFDIKRTTSQVLNISSCMTDQ
jgi:hypothetical protein